jgi:hypothetical protein
VTALMAQDARLTGSFTQTRQLRGFKRPLVSKGTFVLVRDGGLTWETLQPFPSKLEVRRDVITTTQGSREVFRLDARQQPGAKELTELLFGAIRGDFTALSTRFEVQGQVTGNAWAVTLTPRTEGLKGFVERLELEGDRVVRTLHVVETSGDDVRITLSDVRGGP